MCTGATTLGAVWALSGRCLGAVWALSGRCAQMPPDAARCSHMRPDAARCPETLPHVPRYLQILCSSRAVAAPTPPEGTCERKPRIHRRGGEGVERLAVALAPEALRQERLDGDLPPAPPDAMIRNRETPFFKKFCFFRRSFFVVFFCLLFDMNCILTSVFIDSPQKLNATCRRLKYLGEPPFPPSNDKRRQNEKSKIGNDETFS